MDHGLFGVFGPYLIGKWHVLKKFQCLGFGNLLNTHKTVLLSSLSPKLHGVTPVKADPPLTVSDIIWNYQLQISKDLTVQHKIEEIWIGSIFWWLFVQWVSCCHAPWVVQVIPIFFRDIYWVYVGYIWDISRTYQGHIWDISKVCLAHVWYMSESFLENRGCS